jgi:hypothetical protein
MNSTEPVTAETLQDYIEGCRAADPVLQRHLDQNPGLAAQVRRLQHQVEQLREFGESLLREPVPARFYQLLWHHSA